MDDVFIHEIELPMAARAATIPDENGDFTIIINESLSAEAKQTAIEHEMSHIKNDHFYRDLSVVSDESEARCEENSKSAKRYLKNIKVT